MLKYEIALINVFWEENGKNTRYFESLQEQKDYFEKLANNQYSNLVNFNMGNNIDTSVVYKDTTNKSLTKLVASNYAIIRSYQYDEITKTRIGEFTYRYFFAYCKQDSGRQLIVNLSLDDIQTNYFKYKDTIKDCVIRRAHLNRFKEVDSTNVEFNAGVDSPLFESEPLGNFPKRLTRRLRMNIDIDTSSPTSPINKWIKENILCWNYIYISSNIEYVFVNQGNSQQRIELNPIKYNNNFPGGVSVICIPIYKNPSSLRNAIYHRISLGSLVNMKIGEDKGLEAFRLLNHDKSTYYTSKVSFKPPYPQKDYTNQYKIDENNNLILYSIGGESLLPPINSENSSDYLFNAQTKLDEGKSYGIMIVNKDIPDYLTTPYFHAHALKFTKERIINSNKDFRLNPKMLTSDFFTLKVTNGAGDNYDYDLLKLNKESIRFKYTEVDTPDVTKGYTRVHDTDGYYDPNTEYNLTGLVSSNDMSLPYSNSELGQMLANNKNFYLASNIGIGYNLAKNVVNGVMNQKVGSIVGGVIDTGLALIQRGLTIDNMDNSPEQLKNANGNALFNDSISQIGIYIEEYKPNFHEIEIANDFMYENGFTFNRIGNLKDYDNIRKRFNYIEADIEVINAPLSIEEKRRLRERFNDGIRFWNSDSIDFSKENYERWLE